MIGLISPISEYEITLLYSQWKEIYQDILRIMHRIYWNQGFQIVG